MMGSIEEKLREMAAMLPDLPSEPSRPASAEPAVIAERPIFYIAHAYTPNEQAMYGGADHIVSRDAVKLGRALFREPRDALCKPERKFWGLQACPERPLSAVTCKRCREIAIREGLVTECAGLLQVEHIAGCAVFRDLGHRRIYQHRCLDCGTSAEHSSDKNGERCGALVDAKAVQS